MNSAKSSRQQWAPECRVCVNFVVSVQDSDRVGQVSDHSGRKACQCFGPNMVAICLVPVANGDVQALEDKGL